MTFSFFLKYSCKKRLIHKKSFFIANEDTPQVYAACGRGPRSSLRIMRHGLEVTEMAVSELPGSPNAVWTVKKRADGNFRLSSTFKAFFKVLFFCVFFTFSPAVILKTHALKSVI